MENVTIVRPLHGRTALVTGAGRGIGREISSVLAAADANVIVNDLHQADVDEVAAQISSAGGVAIGVAADISELGGARHLAGAGVEEFGAIDILVNNAAVLIRGSVMELTEENLDRMLSVILKGALFCMQANLPGMIERAHGRIVNVTSIAAHVPRWNLAGYCTAKSALGHLTRCVALEAAGTGVTANMVAPGPVRTELSNAWGSDRSGDELVAGNPVEFRLPVPIGRALTTDEQAAAVLFLASDSSGGITGHTLHVDGGLVML